MDSKLWEKLSLQELYALYTNLDKNLEPEKAELIIEYIKERETGERESLIELANRGTRLGAVIIDSIIMMIIILPILIIFFRTEILNEQMDGVNIQLNIIIFAMGQLLFLILNGYLLYTAGQTVGKKTLDIKIVNLDNKLPEFTSIYGLRYFLISIFDSIPIIGSFFALIDALFVFREDKRCIHDLIAGTKVIKA